jgi:hypothetical protein
MFISSLHLTILEVGISCLRDFWWSFSRYGCTRSQYSGACLMNQIIRHLIEAWLFFRARFASSASRLGEGHISSHYLSAVARGLGSTLLNGWILAACSDIICMVSTRMMNCSACKEMSCKLGLFVFSFGGIHSKMLISEQFLLRSFDSVRCDLAATFYTRGLIVSNHLLWHSILWLLSMSDDGTIVISSFRASIRIQYLVILTLILGNFVAHRSNGSNSLGRVVDYEREGISHKAPEAGCG